jgi:serine/threonine protein kinase/Tol biopolymer transport system component
MPIFTGEKLGPYEILAPLGAGGMGEVYRARDSRLGRDVAIKVLPASFAADPDRLRRFELEARATGMLNHPNILAVYDIGTHEGAPYLVTELLEGDTLRGHIPLPRRKTIEYAQQIANGLAAAHAKGVTHRDLKPENIFITNDGHVKILDFGLAKVTSADATQTATLNVTAPGTAMGTAGYMSPEQVRGQAIDQRSDIFSLGVILYEMLSGQRAFQGDSAVEAMNAILKSDPPPLPDASFDRLIRHCLEKNPEERLQSARDLRFYLDTLSSPSQAPAGPAIQPVSHNRSRLMAGLAAVIIAIACVAAGHYLWKIPPAPPPALHILTFDQGYVWSARFTPDGQSVVYGAAWKGNPLQLFSVRLGSVDSRALGLPSADLLSISSSGEMAISTGRHYTVGFNNSGKLARVGLDGRVPREVLDDVLCADWSPDGHSLALVRSVGGRYRLEYPQGTVLYETSGWIAYARVSPDGQTVAFLDHPLTGDDRGTVAIVDRQRKKTTLSQVWPGEAGLAWAPGGKEIWFTASDADFYTIRAVSLSGKQRVVMRSLGDLELQDISKDGRVLVTSFQRRLGLIGSAPGEGGEHDWSWFDYSLFNNISSDGSKLLFSESSGAGGPLYSVFLRRTDGSPAVRLGDGRGEAISPDGKWVLALVPTSPPQLSLLPTGAGEPRMLSRDSIDYQRAWWFPDGKRILVAGSEPGHSSRLYVRDLEGGKLQPVTPEKVEVSVGQDILSPDGKWIAVSEAGQNAKLYPVDGGEPRPISGIAEGDVPIQWTADGRSLYVRRWDEIPARVFRLDLGTGRRELWKQVMPADHTGVIKISGILPTPDGRAYAYSYLRVLSGMYVVEGLK